MDRCSVLLPYDFIGLKFEPIGKLAAFLQTCGPIKSYASRFALPPYDLTEQSLLDAVDMKLDLVGQLVRIA